MVCITWDRWQEDEQKSTALAEFWDPKTGKVQKLYPCPKCNKAFVGILTATDFKYCPRCGQEIQEKPKTLMSYD